MQALNVLIKKLDKGNLSKYQSQVPQHLVLNLNEENVDTSIDKTKILCDTSNLSPL